MQPSALSSSTNSLLERYEAALKSAISIPLKRIHRSQVDNPLEEGIRLATMHRVKGLQFDYVFLPTLNTGTMPLEDGLHHSADETSPPTVY